MQSRLLLLGLLAIMTASVAWAQSFTYQGFLRQGGNPANGTFSMTFTLFNHPTNTGAGAQVGSPITLNNVAVQNGLFTVELNFGSVWDGSDRWLEIRIGATTLSPRVKINPTPYASYSNATRGLIVDSNLNVGLTDLRRTIGLNPADAFVYDGKTMGHYTLGWFDDSWNGLGGTTWLSGYAGIKLFTNGTLRLAVGQGGNVGIGTSSPGCLLHVQAATSDRAIYGVHTATSGFTHGVFGQTASTNGRGVVGLATADSGSTLGVYGQSNSTSGIGVVGFTPATSGNTIGVYGQTNSTEGVGVAGYAPALSGVNIGVVGKSDSARGIGVYGYAAATTGGITRGVLGVSKSRWGAKEKGIHYLPGPERLDAVERLK